MKNNENGRSMVEMLGVLAIIGVLSAGGLAGYSKAMFKHKLNSTMDQITMLVTNIRTAYGQQGNYNGLTLAKAYQLGIIPSVMASSSSGPFTNPFKGTVALDLSTAKGTTVLDGDSTDAATAFVLTYGGLPREACIALATADFGSGAGSGFIGVKAFPGSTSKVDGKDTNNNAASLKVGDNTEGKALKMSEALASTACGSEVNTVSWKFY